MKTRLQISFLSILLMLSIPSCVDPDYFPCVSPNGHKIDEVRVTNEFTSINLAMHAEVYVTTGTTNSVKVVAHENVLEHIHVYSNGTTLFIENTQCLQTRTGDIEVYVTTPQLNSVDVAGSGNIYVESPFTGNRIKLGVSGSGNIHMHDLSYNEVKPTISGSGDIILSGITDFADIRIGGSGKVRAYDLVSIEADIDISGSGDVRITVLDFIDARISGSGNIFYMGDPSMRILVTGSGSIHRVIE